MEIAETATLQALNQQTQQLTQKVDKLNQELTEVSHVSQVIRGRVIFAQILSAGRIALYNSP